MLVSLRYHRSSKGSVVHGANIHATLADAIKYAANELRAENAPNVSVHWADFRRPIYLPPEYTPRKTLNRDVRFDVTNEICLVTVGDGYDCTAFSIFPMTDPAADVLAMDMGMKIRNILYKELNLEPMELTSMYDALESCVLHNNPGARRTGISLIFDEFLEFQEGVDVASLVEMLDRIEL